MINEILPGSVKSKSYLLCLSNEAVCCPGPPLTPSQVRRMSELSSLSVTVAERDFKMRPVR